MNLPDEQYQSLVADHRSPPLINIGVGKALTIRELVKVVKAVVGYERQITWDQTKPDGTPRKLLDVSRLSDLGWKPRTGLKESIQKAYDDYFSRIERGG